jgi:hypothetical protein
MGYTVRWVCTAISVGIVMVLSKGMDMGMGMGMGMAALDLVWEVMKRVGEEMGQVGGMIMANLPDQIRAWRKI